MVDFNPQFPNNPKPAGQNRSGPDNSAPRSNSIADILNTPRSPDSPRNGEQLAAPESRNNFFNDTDDLFIPPEGPGIAKARSVAKTSGKLFGRAFDSSKGLCRGIFQQFNSIFQSFIRNPSALAWGSGVGALITGILAAKNIFHGINAALGRRTDDNISSLPYLFQGLLQGGLTTALLSTIFGWRSPFMQKIGNKLAVSKRAIIGGIVAPLLMGLWIKLAEGNTMLTRIPVLGPMVHEVAKTPLKWLKDAFKAKDEIPSAMGAGAQQAAQP
jgi:hypothetical protein